MIPRSLVTATLLAFALPAGADVYNLKVVTDASPDYSDLDSLPPIQRLRLHDVLDDLGHAFARRTRETPMPQSLRGMTS